MVEDSAVWSSPISASTPPCFDGAGEIGVAEHVAGAVDARPLAVPHGEHAIVLALAAQFGLLRAPDRGRGEILVDAALEADVVLVEERRRAQELAVEAAERRAAIAGDEARGIEPVAAVELLLHQAEPHQRLEAGDEHAALAEIVFVFELDVAQRHRESPATVCPHDLDFARGLISTITYRLWGGAGNAAGARRNRQRIRP